MLHLIQGQILECFRFPEWEIETCAVGLSSLELDFLVLVNKEYLLAGLLSLTHTIWNSWDGMGVKREKQLIKMAPVLATFCVEDFSLFSAHPPPHNTSKLFVFN